MAFGKKKTHGGEVGDFKQESSEPGIVIRIMVNIDYCAARRQPEFGDFLTESQDLSDFATFIRSGNSLVKFGDFLVKFGDRIVKFGHFLIRVAAS